MKAVVCEDEEALQLFLEKQVCECMKEAGINGSCEVFSSAEELLEKGNPFYDLYLLDIQLGQMTGMELAEKIREKDDHAVILFATNYKEMIRKAFLDPKSDQVLVVAHRGNWRSAPENSVAAIDSAIQMGVDIVEIDIHKTKDGQLILMHDDRSIL